VVEVDGGPLTERDWLEEAAAAEDASVALVMLKFSG
jgi:hypothetical protein